VLRAADTAASPRLRRRRSSRSTRSPSFTRPPGFVLADRPTKATPPHSPYDDETCCRQSRCGVDGRARELSTAHRIVIVMVQRRKGSSAWDVSRPLVGSHRTHPDRRDREGATRSAAPPRSAADAFTVSPRQPFAPMRALLPSTSDRSFGLSTPWTARHQSVRTDDSLHAERYREARRRSGRCCWRCH